MIYVLGYITHVQSFDCAKTWDC